MNIKTQMIPLLPPSVVYFSCFVRGMDCHSVWFPVFPVGFFTSNRPTDVPLDTCYRYYTYSYMFSKMKYLDCITLLQHHRLQLR